MICDMGEASGVGDGFRIVNWRQNSRRYPMQSPEEIGIFWNRLLEPKIQWNCCILCMCICILVGGAITILKNISQWEGISRILIIMENKKCVKPPTSIYIYIFMCDLQPSCVIIRNIIKYQWIHLFGAHDISWYDHLYLLPGCWG